MKKFEIHLAYSDIFSEELPSDSFAYLRKYSTENILTKLAHINAIIFTQRVDSDIRVFQQVLFGSNNIPDSILRAISMRLNNGTFFRAQSISLLIKYSLSNYKSQQEDLLYNDFAVDLFKTILIFNQRYLDPLEKLNDFRNFKSLFKLDVMQQNYIRPRRFTNFMVKSAFTCAFLNRDKLLKPFVIEFCRIYGMGNPWKISQFLINLFQENSGDYAKFVIMKSSVPSNLLNDWIIEGKTLAEDKISLNFDIIPKPLFGTEGDEVIILDLSFLQYIIDQGFFYNIYKKTIVNSDSIFKNFNNYKGYIGKEYFEQYLCKEFLRKIFFRREQIVISTEKYQDFWIKSTSDNLLIIEVKMVDLHASIIEDMNFEAFKESIDKNFLNEKGNGKKNKGAFQIIRQINLLADSKNDSEIRQLLKVKKIKNLNVYPILITSDTNYSLMGTNKYIINRTEEHIVKFKDKFKTVKPVVIVNVNVLIEYFPYLIQNKFHLTDLIKGYIDEISKWEKRHNSNNDIYSYYEASQSFDEYLHHKLNGLSLVENFEVFEENFRDEISNIDFSSENTNSI